MNYTKQDAQKQVGEYVEYFRLDVNNKLNPKTKGELGQFMTQRDVASFMASIFTPTHQNIELLDPGAGVGSLSAAFIDEVARWRKKPKTIKMEAFEIEPIMHPYLGQTINICEAALSGEEVKLTGKINKEDFIEKTVGVLKTPGKKASAQAKFSHCIINPPYKKISNSGRYRALLREVDMETSNLYTGFLTMAIKMLRPGGEMVAIVPRSFCNGVYFKPFRKFLLEQVSIEHLHVFHSRKSAFKQDAVLQENIIFRVIKGKKQGRVKITGSAGVDFDDMTERMVSFDKVVNPDDADVFIHIATNNADQKIVDAMAAMDGRLSEIGIEVRTGPIVDFRMKEDIFKRAGKGHVPLIYPGHFEGQETRWPKPDGKKPNAIARTPETERWLMDNGFYVLAKRFSSKEEKRRIVAAVHDPKKVPGERIGFENHINVFHQRKKGLDEEVARGLALYLNSSLVDLYFRQFSGHTQVNATDLRMLRYPKIAILKRLGREVMKLSGGEPVKQGDIDDLITRIIFMDKKTGGDILQGQRKIDEALSILKIIGMPRAQCNERSALTLLALVDLHPSGDWSQAKEPLIGITPIMEFCDAAYGKSYKPNTRETFRRQTMHQFMEAGIAISNPDKPNRPVNSPKWVYQIAPDALVLFKQFGTNDWDAAVIEYGKIRKGLAAQYAKERDMLRIPLKINNGKELTLTPGVHSELIKDIIEQFGPRYAPGSQVLYVGDTGSKLGHFEKESFKQLGLSFNNHGKFPDVVLHFKEKNWLLLIESVTSHGPVDAKRHGELAELFAKSTAGLVYVTAFPNRNIMAKYLPFISWETEVWVADAPTHLIHFNGERFLGPYEDK